MLSHSLPQLRAVILHPAPDHCVIDMETAFLEQLFNIGAAQESSEDTTGRHKG